MTSANAPAGGMTLNDISDAADDVAKVADALHDMLMGEREVVIEFWMVDVLMFAHGVLWGLLEEPKPDNKTPDDALLSAISPDTGKETKP